MKTAFTIDVDCDAAWHREGGSSAVTLGEDAALFDSSEKGLKALLEMLDEAGWPATFFFEARAARITDAPALKGHEVACHGFAHEDFTGESTGVKMAREEKKETLKKAKSVLEEFFGREVKGFRAPYLHWDAELLALLKETGFVYDSSMTRGSTTITNVNGGIREVPLLELNKKSSYLWRLLEGFYGVREYAGFVDKALEENGFLVIATHSWHLHRSIGKGVLGGKEAGENLDKVRGALNAAEKKGAAFTTIRDYLGENK